MAWRPAAIDIAATGAMEIVVRDDAEALGRVIALPPSERLAALAEMAGAVEDDAGTLAFLRQIHEQGDGFRLGRVDPHHRQGLDRLVAADAWGGLRRQLNRAWEAIRAAVPGIRHPTRVDVTLSLGNPDDGFFIERNLGYYGMGSTPGTIWLVCWPTEYNLPRIGACGVHELVHNIRSANIADFGLAEWIVQEGLAEVFTLELCGPESTGGWYAAVTGRELEATWDRVTAAFGTGASFPDWTPYVMGDEAARRFGAAPAGIPHMGGYAVGRRLVERHLAAAGITAAQAIARPTQEILSGAGL